ncbi:glycosyltransferase [bacterium]|nr:glycosyltransferase [bacterium]
MTEQSIFQRLYSEEEFVDRFANNPTHAVDVIIPVLHTNELWYKNLISIYREIPVNRLLLGDGGCIDDTIEIAKQFPRVEVFDHKQFKTLGYSIMQLIKEVQTEFFIYLHSDVYIADGWFDKFYLNTEKYDWFECEQRHVCMLYYERKFADEERGFGFGGTQMGRKAAFDDIMNDLDDDYIYRNEDIIIRTALQKKGHKWGFDDTLFHYHESMYKQSPNGRKLKSLKYDLEIPKHEQFKHWNMQLRGFVKYLEPNTPSLRQDALYLKGQLLGKKLVNKYELIEWIEKTNKNWLFIFTKKELLRYRLKKFLKII